MIPLGLNATEAARVLGVARHTLSRILNGHAGISPEMAIRLEKAGWSNAGSWLRRQASYDLAQARKREDEIKVARTRSPVRWTDSPGPGRRRTACRRPGTPANQAARRG